MTDHTQAQPDPQPFRLPDSDLDDLAGTLARTVAEVRRHGVLLDRLSTEPDTGPGYLASDALVPADGGPGTAEDDRPDEEAPASLFILALGGSSYETELAALRDWVDHLLLPVYGREISTTRPWCEQWLEHPEAVARLHALWLAWQQLTEAVAGLSGPSTWHRDHLDHALAQLRAPDGPFAACTTSANRRNHRVLPTPAPQAVGATQ
jgi:hypothetical protein